MALSPQDAELLARIMGGPLSQLQGMTAPPQITPEMAFGAPTMPGAFAPAGDSRSIPQAAFGPMPDAMRAVPSPQMPRGGAFVPLVPGQGEAPQPYGGPDTPLARANFGGPPAPAPAPAMAAYGPVGGAAPGSAAFSPLPQAADRLSAIPPDQMPGGGMFGKIPMPEEFAGQTVGLGADGFYSSGGPMQSAVATNDAPMAQQPSQGGLGGLGGFFSGIFGDPGSDRREDFQNWALGLAMGAGGTWQDSLAGGAKAVMAGRMSRKEKNELAQSKNKTLEWAISKGVDPATAQAYIEAGGAKDLINYVENATQPQKRDSVVVDGRLVDKQTGEVIADYRDPNGGGGTEYGLNPQFGVDVQGNPVAIQFGKDGRAVQTALPEGVQLSKEPIRLDAGTHFVLLDPITRQPIGQVAKNLGEAEAQKAAGRLEGEAGAQARLDLGGNLAKAEQALALIESVRNDPALPSITGMFQGRLPPMTQAGTDLLPKIEQLQGKTFLEAFESLKGGGQITVVEGQKAEQAIARLQRAQSDTAYRAALDELAGIVRTGMDRARARAGQPAVQEQTQQDDSRQNLYDKYGLER